MAVKTLFELNISHILKDILSTLDFSHGVPSTLMVDGHYNQVLYKVTLFFLLLIVMLAWMRLYSAAIYEKGVVA